MACIIASGCTSEGGGFFARLLKGGGSAVPVTVESVVVQERSQELRIPAVFESSETTDVALPEDVAIERFLVKEGDTVNSGDPILRISEQEISFRQARVRTDIRDAKATLDKNTYLYKNRDRLLEEGRLDRNQYDSLEAEIVANEAAVEKLQQELTRLEERSANVTITSPASGQVSKIHALSGTTVLAARPIMTLTRSDPVMAVFRLPSQNSAVVRAGQSVRVRIVDLGGETIVGRITQVGTELDRDGTFGVRAALPNPAGRLKVGMKAEVGFTSPDKQRFFLIPEEALIKERHAYFVFTVAKGVAHKVQVIPNETIGSRVEIARGLTEEDLVVVKGNDKLTEGTVVDIWGK